MKTVSTHEGGNTESCSVFKANPLIGIDMQEL